jgi:hypothetical protein
MHKKIIAENFSNIEKKLPIPILEASRTPKIHDQSRNSSWHIIFKTSSIEK